MKKLLNRSLQQFLIYAGLVLIGSIPVYYLIISKLWQYEMEEHNIILTEDAAKHDSFMIILAVTSLTALFFVLLLTGFVLLNRNISRRLWRPFYQSLDQIKHFDLNQQTSVEFPRTDIAEFSELNQELDKLISGNVSAYRQQREFADNASHELQTPLAIVQSKLDLLLQSKSLTNDQYNIIEEAFTALTRVSRINKNLLLLTKMENSQFMEKEQVNFSLLLADSITQFASFAEAKDLQMITEIDSDFQVNGNRVLVEILVNNLITNAIRHSATAGKIFVRLGHQELLLKNTGSMELNPDQLFKRFSTASSATPGTGLGLSLVKQICQRYDWSINYSYAEGLHVFSLRF